MRALQGLVIFMGVLIVVGMGTIAVTLVRRSHAPPPSVADLTMTDLTMDEPAGTQIAGISPLGARLAVLLHGGGSDRVVIVDGGGQIVGHIKLKR